MDQRPADRDERPRSGNYPLLRTALESACYALLINRRPNLAAVWSARHDGEVQRKACRKAFGSAVADAAATLNASQTGFGDFVADLYDAHIDAGAHPNTRAVMNHIHSVPGQSDSRSLGLGLGSLYPGNSFQVFRTLVAVAESARGIGMVLTTCLPVMPETVSDAIRALEAQHATLMPGPKV